MADLDPEFIANVKVLAENGTLKEVLRRIKAQCVAGWEVAINPDERERAWYLLKAIDALKAEITSLKTDEKVREFNAKVRRVS
jgi:hypothetical protein